MFPPMTSNTWRNLVTYLVICIVAD
jgi:hypothetical protein